MASTLHRPRPHIEPRRRKLPNLQGASVRLCASTSPLPPSRRRSHAPHPTPLQQLKYYLGSRTFLNPLPTPPLPGPPTGRNSESSALASEWALSITPLGAVMAERLACSHPIKANRVQSPAGSPALESCRTMPLVGGFFSGISRSPAPSFRRCSIFISNTLIGSQKLAVKSRPNLLTHCDNVAALEPFLRPPELTSQNHGILDGRDGSRSHVLTKASPVCYTSITPFDPLYKDENDWYYHNICH
ncbi:hypothetical protein PR048_017371 [Dryococelus australis]|uniref:Uncharacterized protein n=1 Tax=Dryococelus australis TaxID=614101 RepID=A0ABQ9H9X3_9NEOP|nr:hypothetical protein PR048_017371 [Dryococelus australis]